jgi:hypothetical protein
MLLERTTMKKPLEISLQNGEATVTMEVLINVAAPSPGNNLFGPIFFHTMLNANGEVTSFVIDFTGGPRD